MLGIVTTLSTLGTTACQPTDSEIQLKASTEYIINTLNITSLKVFSADDSDIRYKLNRFEDQTPEMLLRVSQTNAQVVALSDVTPASNMIALDVFLGETSEDCLTFAECLLAGSSTTTKYYNIDDISWIEENAAGTMSMLLLAEGGHDIRKIFVDHNLDQIIDLVATGTTTTTTSTTTAEQ